jgi:hypothetical protein
MRSSLLRLGWTAAMFAALCIGSCSVLVDPDSLTIKCEVPPGGTGDDPCLPAGMHCVDSECKPCKDAVELCNGVDDDCDGVVDNGFDDDGDGFTFCGGGLPELADCAPTDASIHPAGKARADGVIPPAPKELCDGKDNDCDSKVDEAPECASMRTCAADDDCPASQICDTKTGTCIVPRPVGSGCKLDAECAGGFCVTPKDFGLTIKLTDNRCASACCADSDCASGSVCVVNRSGSRMCLPSNIVARPTTKTDRCSDDEDCAPGACDRNRCAPRCLSERACGTSSVCALSPGNGSDPRQWVCGESAGRQPGGAACTSLDPSSCRSGLCSDRGTCAKPCGHGADCATDETCGYTQVRPSLGLIGIGPASIATTCEPRASVELNMVLCCTNADCAKAGLCAPQQVESNLWVMGCN